MPDPKPAPDPTWRRPDTADHARLPELDSSRIRLLLDLHHFDGPLNGMALYADRKVWFDFHHMDDEGAHYAYTLDPLTGSQAAGAELWHQTRGRYQHPRRIGRDEARHDPTYNGPSFPDVQPLGWFIDGPNAAFYAIDSGAGSSVQTDVGQLPPRIPP